MKSEWSVFLRNIYLSPLGAVEIVLWWQKKVLVVLMSAAGYLEQLLPSSQLQWGRASGGSRSDCGSSSGGNGTSVSHIPEAANCAIPTLTQPGRTCSQAWGLCYGLNLAPHCISGAWKHPAEATTGKMGRREGQTPEAAPESPLETTSLGAIERGLTESHDHWRAVCSSMEAGAEKGPQVSRSEVVLHSTEPVVAPQVQLQLPKLLLWPRHPCALGAGSRQETHPPRRSCSCTSCSYGPGNLCILRVQEGLPDTAGSEVTAHTVWLLPTVGPAPIRELKWGQS